MAEGKSVDDHSTAANFRMNPKASRGCMVVPHRALPSAGYAER
jgi:hypothetical protein